MGIDSIEKQLRKLQVKQSQPDFERDCLEVCSKEDIAIIEEYRSLVASGHDNPTIELFMADRWEFLQDIESRNATGILQTPKTREAFCLAEKEVCRWAMVLS